MVEWVNCGRYTQTLHNHKKEQTTAMYNYVDESDGCKDE